MYYSLTAAYGCNMGVKRRNNEDNLYFAGKVLPENHFEQEVIEQSFSLNQEIDFGVFDGMGGHVDGQIASNIAATYFKIFRQSKPANAKKLMEEAVAFLNEAVWHRASKDMSNMGTTATLLALKGRKYWLADVGDSPVFIWRKNKLKQISMSHLQENYIGNKDKKKCKNVLTQYIGMDPNEFSILPYITKGYLMPGDYIIMCSDGITDMISEEQISEVLKCKEEPFELVSDLIEAANQQGGKDNITVIVIRVNKAKHFWNNNKS